MADKKGRPLSSPYATSVCTRTHTHTRLYTLTVTIREEVMRLRGVELVQKELKGENRRRSSHLNKVLVYKILNKHKLQIKNDNSET